MSGNHSHPPIKENKLVSHRPQPRHRRGGGGGRGGVGESPLLSDALHNVGDAFSLVVSLVALRLAGRQNDERRTFGYKRAEVLAALFNTALILAASAFMVKEAVGRLIHPVRINGWLVVVVALAGLLGNVGSILLLRRDARDSLNIRSSYLHLVSDAFSSVAVLLGGIVVVLFKWDRVDALLTFVVVGAVMWQGFRLMKETAGVLMESVPDHIRVEEIQTEIERLPEVRNIHHLHVWQITDNDIHMEGHVNLKEDLTVSRCADVRGRIEELVGRRFHIGHVTIQFEHGGCDGVALIKT